MRMISNFYFLINEDSILIKDVFVERLYPMEVIANAVVVPALIDTKRQPEQYVEIYKTTCSILREDQKADSYLGRDEDYYYYFYRYIQKDEC